MASFTAPLSQSGTNATWGRSFEYIGDALTLELAESADMLALGVFSDIVDVARTGAMTVRRRYAGGLGYALRMTAMASETEAITATGITGNYDDLTVARYGLAHEETVQHMMVQQGEVTLEDLARAIAQSWTSTVRYLFCVSGAAISSASVNQGTAATVTNWATLVTSFAETAGYKGGATAVLHPEQITDLRASLRSETASQSDLAALASTQTLGGTENAEVFSFWDIKVLKSHDIQDSSSRWQGFAFAPGAFGLGIGDPSRADIPAGAQPVFVPDMGMLLTRGFTGRQAYGDVTGNSWVGVGRRAVALAPQFRFCTVND